MIGRRIFSFEKIVNFLLHMVLVSVYNRRLSFVFCSMPNPVFKGSLFLGRLVGALVALLLLLFLAFPIGFYGMAMYIEPSLPDTNALTTMPLEMPLQIYTADHKLIGYYGNRYSLPLTYEELPRPLINAFLAAEDSTFFEHSGISVKGLGRAITQMIGDSDQQTGGSTITQQVAKNYFLSSEQTFERKLTELFLARKIEKELSKNDIMTLYVNKIYLGQGAYGIKAGAKRYYGKSLETLTLAQMAMLAGLPKAPSEFNPVANPERALERRNWILGRMLSNGYISKQDYQSAINEPINLNMYEGKLDLDLPYVSELARTALVQQYGDAVMTSGWKVVLTINSEDQLVAEEAIKKGLKTYTSQYGIQGSGIESQSGNLADVGVYDDLQPAKVTQVQKNKLLAVLKSGETITLPRMPLVSEGNIIRVFPTNKDKTHWQMKKAQQAQAALVSLDPNDGALIAAVGGYSFYQKKFNRAVQGYRQPGSTIKPLVYAAAMEYKKLNPESSVSNAQQKNNWPKNAGSGGYGGFSTLRSALAVSRNTAAVNVLKIAQLEPTRILMTNMGLEKERLPQNLTLALGSADATPLQMSTAYATFINGGHRIDPYVVARIYGFYNDLIYEANPVHACAVCFNSKLDQTNEALVQSFEQDHANKSTAKDGDTFSLSLDTQPKPEDDSPQTQIAVQMHTEADATSDRLAIKEPVQYKVATQAPRILSKRVANDMADMLRTVVRSGTAKKANALGRPDIGGKTGTTNKAKDVWFAGVNPHVATVVWVGFDQPRSLGAKEFGGTRALPIWMDFMRYKLKDIPVEWVDGASEKAKPTKLKEKPKDLEKTSDPVDEPTHDENDIIPEGDGESATPDGN